MIVRSSFSSVISQRALISERKEFCSIYAQKWQNCLPKTMFLRYTVADTRQYIEQQSIERSRQRRGAHAHTSLSCLVFCWHGRISDATVGALFPVLAVVNDSSVPLTDERDASVRRNWLLPLSTSSRRHASHATRVLKPTHARETA